MPLQAPQQQQQPCPVSRVVTVKGLTVKLSVEEEIPLDVRVCLEERIEGRIKSERIALESLSAGTDPGVPGQQRLSSWEMQRTTADGCSLVDVSLDLGEITSLEDFLINGAPFSCRNRTPHLYDFFLLRFVIWLLRAYKYRQLRP